MAGIRHAVTAALLASLAQSALAAVVSLDWNISWVYGNPDGAFNRPVIGVNGQWPIPKVDADVGDNIIIDVHNHLGNQTTSLHFHGLFMNGTTEMDGPVQVSQCGIPPGHSMKYNFTIQQPGTYWIHSHANGQYPDGIRTPLVIHDPKNPFKGQYDEEIVLSVSDWYHEQMQILLPKFANKGNPTGAEPVPNAALMNDTQNLTISVQPGKTYLFRMVNMAAFASQYIWFEGHNITIVEIDGVYTKPAVASMIFLGAAQRCSFLLTTRNDTSANFPVIGSMDTTLFDTLPPSLNYNVTSWLVYDDKKPLPAAAFVDKYDFFDDINLTPHDDMGRLPEPDHEIELSVIMNNLNDGANYAFFNNITYKAPKVPTLYTALSAGEQAMDAAVYGEYTHSFVLKKGEIVQIVLNNLDSGRHPFHLHGHQFQALYRSIENGGTFANSSVSEAELPKVPMRRDTLMVWPGGNIVMRFRADNPGVWLFHCHIEWHLATGLIATMVEAPLDLQQTINIPQDHLDACAAGNVPVKGNAAANAKDFTDLSGQPKPPSPLPAGFTTKGIVALVFSCVAGVVGVIIVAWFGMTTAEGARDVRPNGSVMAVAGGVHDSSSDNEIRGESKVVPSNVHSIGD